MMRFTGPVSVETTTTPMYRIVYYGQQQMDTVARKLYPSVDDGAMMQTIEAPASVTHFGEVAKYGVVLYYTKKYRDAGGAIIAPGEGNMMVRREDPSTPQSEMSSRILANLFNGISLAPDKSSQARTIIEKEMASQHAIQGPGLAIFPQRIALNATRDAQLRALLASDADRARFDRRSREGRPCCTPTIDDVVNMEFGNLFGYPDEQPSQFRAALPADKQERAHNIIRTNISDELALYARAPNEWTSNVDERVAMRVKRDAAIRDLVATDAGKDKFDRIAARLREMERKRS